MSAQVALWLTIAVPLIGAVMIVMLDRRPNPREAVTLITSIALFALVMRLWFALEAEEATSVVLVETLPGLPLALNLEPLGLMFASVASLLWIVTALYSIGYMRAHHEKHQTRFYCAFAIALASTMGVAFAQNMFTLFVCYEALTLSTYPLVTHSGTQEARRAGRVYLGLLLGTSIGLQLLAIVWTWMLTGTLDFRQGGILAGSASPVVIGILYTLYIFGIGKAALMPFHRWLPAAMVAPTPVSALLHAVAVVKAGVFTVLKVTVYLFGLEVLTDNAATQWLLYVAGATILVASLVAMAQDNLKARLAYSTVSQLGYVVLGALLANSWGVLGGALHIAMHAFGKITLFFCAGAILVVTHKTEVSQLSGLGRTMPVTMGAFFVASLSIIGLPPLGGLWSKWYLALGTLDAGQLGLLAILMISSLLNIAYLLTIPIRAFLQAPGSGKMPAKIQEAPISCLIAIVFTSLACVVLFFYPDPLYALARLLVIDRV